MRKRDTSEGFSALTAFWQLLWATAILFSAVAAVAGFSGWSTAQAVFGLDRWWDDLADLPEEFADPPERSVIYDADGGALATLHDEQNRRLVSLEEMGVWMPAAVIATEDASFHEHGGVDGWALLRAGITNFQSGGVEQGASTITQQLVKNLTGDDAISIERKAVEARRALHLEQRLTKDEILERYLNTAYLGRGVYGVAAAAERYFGVDPDELTVGQAATLAGMLRSPEGGNPLLEPERALARRNIVLRQMARHGKISPADADEAIERDLELDAAPLEPPRDPLFVEYVKQTLFSEPALGDTRAERIRTVFEGGLEIDTTLDPTLQAHAEDAVAEFVSDADDPMAALVSVSPVDGGVRALAVGPHEFGDCDPDEEETCLRSRVNPVVPLAGGSGRQPGSAFKPFVAAASLEAGTPPDTRHDSRSGREIPGCLDGTSPWQPTNYAGGGGTHDLPSAMRVSSNVYFALLTGQVGPSAVADTAAAAGLESSSFPDGCAIGLGSAEVFPVEMAVAYGTLVADGTRCRATPVAEVRDRDGDVLLSSDDLTDCDDTVHPAVARAVTSTLPDVISSGTARSAAVPGHNVAGKTGTTDEHVDAWFAGFNAPTEDGLDDVLSTAAWLGFEQPEPMYGVRGVSRVTGGSLPAQMWQRFMADALDDRSSGSFPTMPEPINLGAVVGEPVDAVVERLEAEGLPVTAVETHHWTPEGTVVASDPTGRAWLRQPVVLRVSDGGQDAPRIPSLVGRSQAAATAQLEAAGFTVQVTEAEAQREADDGRVIAQTPDGGAVRGLARPTVTITVGVAPDRDVPEPPEPPEPPEEDEPEEDEPEEDGSDDEATDGDDLDDEARDDDGEDA